MDNPKFLQGLAVAMLIIGVFKIIEDGIIGAFFFALGAGMMAIAAAKKKQQSKGDDNEPR